MTDSKLLLDDVSWSDCGDFKEGVVVVEGKRGSEMFGIKGYDVGPTYEDILKENESLRKLIVVFIVNNGPMRVHKQVVENLYPEKWELVVEYTPHDMYLTYDVKPLEQEEPNGKS
jgi:hypothetical protein